MRESSRAGVDGRSTVRLVLSGPLYRGATLAMFLSGLATSAAAPYIAMFLVDELHASLSTAGLYYLTSLTAPVAGYLVGGRSDRTGARLGLFRGCAVLGAVGWVGVALSTKVWMPFVISALVLAFAGGAASQLFAAVHDQIAADLPGRAREGDAIVSTIRMALTAGWVIGPTLGAWFAAGFGLRGLLLATAVCGLCQIVPLARIRARPVRDPVTATAARPRGGPERRAMWPLLVFTGLYVLVYAGEPIKYGFLPIYMSTQLQLDPGVSGSVIGIQPLIELVLMPVSVILARSVGMMRLMGIGAVFGVGANACFAFSGNVFGMFGGQILMGGVWGIFAALGIIAAQRLLPDAVATASAIFMSAPALSTALGGLTGGVGVAILGLPHVFVLPGLFALAGAVGLFTMARRHPLTHGRAQVVPSADRPSRIRPGT